MNRVLSGRNGLLPFDIICDLLLNRCTATWNVFVKQNANRKYRHKFFLYPYLPPGLPALGSLHYENLWEENKTGE